MYAIDMHDLNLVVRQTLADAGLTPVEVSDHYETRTPHVAVQFPPGTEDDYVIALMDRMQTGAQFELRPSDRFNVLTVYPLPPRGTCTWTDTPTGDHCGEPRWAGVDTEFCEKHARLWSDMRAHDPESSMGG